MRLYCTLPFLCRRNESDPEDTGFEDQVACILYLRSFGQWQIRATDRAALENVIIAVSQEPSELLV
jgi:hypothetical protein